MASKQTEHYGLSLWEATDQVVRLDFNSDNEKIDAGMAENKAAAAAAKETAENLAAVAYTTENAPFVLGSYTGNGVAKRKIALGFTPKAVLLCSSHGRIVFGSDSHYGGLALPGANVSISESAGRTSWSDSHTVVAITDGGFLVNAGTSGIYSNKSSYAYYYMAMR